MVGASIMKRGVMYKEEGVGTSVIKRGIMYKEEGVDPSAMIRRSYIGGVGRGGCRSFRIRNIL